jgi:hypothetical protein
VVMIRRIKTIMSLFGPPNEFLRDNANGKSASQAKSSRKDVAHQRKIFLALNFSLGVVPESFPRACIPGFPPTGRASQKPHNPVRNVAESTTE